MARRAADGGLGIFNDNGTVTFWAEFTDFQWSS